MANMDQEMPLVTDPGEGYAFSGKIMLSAIVILLAVVVFIACFHLYAGWYLRRLRRHRLERRRQLRRQSRRRGRTRIAMHADNQQRGSAMDRGLELAVLKTLPVFLHSSSKAEPPPECAVCLFEFEENEVVRLLPKCNHSFHIECIDMWFHSHSTCPLCRSPVEPVVNQESPILIGSEPIENVNESEPGSCSGSETQATCLHEEGSGRKGLELVGVRIEVPTTNTELEDELTQISTGFRPPGNRLLYLKRILNMSKKSTVSGGSGTTPCGVGSSDSGTDLDLDRLLYLKRILSISKKSTVSGGSGTTPCGVRSSNDGADLDLESGLSELTQESSRVQTPRL